MRVISPLDLRRSLGAILDAASAGERFLVERDRRPVAMLVSVEDGQRLEPDVDEVRRRRLAALDRLEALAAKGPSATAAIAGAARPVAASPAAPRGSAAAAPAVAGSPSPAPRRAAAPTQAATEPPAAAESRSLPPAPPPAPSAAAPRSPTGAAQAPLRTSLAAERHEAERRRHDGEGLVGIG